MNATQKAAQHTPGPWTVTKAHGAARDFGRYFHVTVEPGRVGCIADISGPGWSGMAQSFYDDADEGDGTFTKRERAILDLSDHVKEQINEAAPDLGASCFADLLSAALSEVNWYEIAESLIEDNVEEEETDEESD